MLVLSVAFENKSVFNLFLDDILRESLTIKPFQNVNENKYAAILFGFETQPLICSDDLCKHSEDTPNVALAYFSVTLGQENSDKE